MKPVVTASGAVKDCPEENTIDGSADTRWAADGRDHWIQYRLDPDVETDRIGISWYQGTSRQARFEILVSDDGRQWRKASPRNNEAVTVHTDRIDIFKQTGRTNKVLVYEYPVTLERPGRLDVTLKPVKGKALLCGAILKPVVDRP
ncbi:MAG: hypothetical protein GQ528_06475 [Woeseiaceae bacterium]|nr:hypothetical protein [Woeseiaceae bacterium]